ncbi:hypothetical protein GCM10010191_95450 [Actinomadura vinacea]|uniref:Histidine kinase/HSP90-like ATPase domain-containing protein n=1 Tax=Actinomadura vinacea TaxID=115336 RepID=A0ABP5XQQ2_9ACTN
MVGVYGTPAGPVLPDGPAPVRPPGQSYRAAQPACWRIGELRLSGTAPACWPEPFPGQGWISRLDVAADPGSLHPARELTRRCLGYRGLPGMVWDATTIISELLTNAITHASPSGAALRVILIGHLERLAIVVTDPSHRAPVRRAVAAAGLVDAVDPADVCDRLLAEGGRGLHIVDGLSRAWGWAPLATGGKAVWAVLEDAG